MEEIRLVIPGRPITKKRPRLGIRARGRTIRGVVYTPRESAEYEARIRSIAIGSGVRPMEGELALELHVWVHGARGDGDNYWKSVADALNGVAYHDDRQVIDWRVVIHQARSRSEERAEVTIRPVAREAG